MCSLKDAYVLDLGCFAGNDLSLWIAENCADYTGIDLSEQAIKVLNAKLRERGLIHARGCAQNFLANSYPDNHFDLVYAYSVLHNQGCISHHRGIASGLETWRYDNLA